MRFDVLTLFPEIISAYCDVSIMKRAQDSEVFTLNTINPRDFTIDKHKKVDDTPYGGGAGMVLMAQPYVDAYESVEKVENSLTIMLSPQGEPLDDSIVNDFTNYDQIIMLCGHYEGVDQRVLDEIVDEEISIGDYVLTGGELPAMVVADAVARMLPGVLPEDLCFEEESHFSGLLEYPQYTRPAEWHGKEVPEVLLSGNHAKIDEWRRMQSLMITAERRPDLYSRVTLTKQDIKSFSRSGIPVPDGSQKENT